METSTDLITSRDLLPTVFESASNVEAMIELVERDARAETHDVTTEEGRKGISSLHRKVSRSKTAMAEIGDPLAAAARVKWDDLNVLRSTVTRRLDALRDEIKAPLTRWRDAETARVFALQLHLDELNEMAAPIDDETAESIAKTISLVANIEINDTWEEFRDEATGAKIDVLTRLRTRHHVTEKAEIAAAELEELRRFKLEREAAAIKAEADADIERRIEERADQIRKQAAIAAENALEREKNRAAREVRDAENRVAAAKGEAAGAARQVREQIEAEREADEAERREREADDAHRHDRQETIFKALIRPPAKLSEGDATRVVAALADKMIPFVRIEY